ERQWGTVREEYSPDGTCWDYLPHDPARSRAYRWGEDGLLGLTDRECRLCFAVALWNGRDPILKERLFGLTGPEGNHGEDVKECYFYLDATPTSSYLRALYNYPQREYPYARLVEEGRRRGRQDGEFELVDTGVFEDGRNDGVNPAGIGTKAAAHYVLTLPPGGEARLHLRLSAEAEAGGPPSGPDVDRIFADRIREADAFYGRHIPATLGEGEQAAVRQAYASLLWSRKFFHYVVKQWLEGDPAQPPPPASRWRGRNADWRHLYNRDVISMPDAWEYPWYAAWDLAFHMIPFARIDPQFAKEQLVL